MTADQKNLTQDQKNFLRLLGYGSQPMYLPPIELRDLVRRGIIAPVRRFGEFKLLDKKFDKK